MRKHKMRITGSRREKASDLRVGLRPTTKRYNIDVSVWSRRRSVLARLLLGQRRARVGHSTIDLVDERLRRNRRKIREDSAVAPSTARTRVQESHPRFDSIGFADTVYELAVAAEDSHVSIGHHENVPVKARPSPAERVQAGVSSQNFFLETEPANLDDFAGFQTVAAHSREVAEAWTFDGPSLNTSVAQRPLQRERDVRISRVETDDRALYPDRLADIEHADRMMRLKRTDESECYQRRCPCCGRSHGAHQLLHP